MSSSLYAQNVAFLREHDPALLQQFEGVVGADVKVRRSKSYKGLQLVVGGAKTYESNPHLLVKKQIETWQKLIVFNRFSHKTQRDLGLHGDMVNGLIDAIPLSSNQHPVMDEREIGTLIVFGLGLGSHLTELLKHVRPRHMIVLEAFPEVLKASLHATDYKELFALKEELGIRVTFLATPHGPTLARNIVQAIARFNPNAGAHISFFAHSFCAMFLECKEKVLEELSLVFKGYGFFDDELMGLDNFFETSCTSKVQLLRDVREIQTLGCIVVGSGPSLDENVEWLREHAGQAIVVSCGSAIGALLRNDIKPDFHVEVERIEATYEKLVDLCGTFPRDIPIIGPETLNPKVFGLTDTPIVFRKAASSTGALFLPDAATHEGCGPTVANMGCLFALMAGFRRIMLLGIDFGFKDEGTTKSEGSVTKAESPRKCVQRIDGVIEGEKVLTDDTLLWSKGKLENLLMRARRAGAEVVNLSSYARIYNTIALDLEQVKFSGVEDWVSLCRTTVEEILSHVEDASFENVDLESFSAAFKRGLTWARENLPESSHKGILDYTKIVTEQMNGPVFKDSVVAYYLLRGTLQYFASITMSEAMCLKEPMRYLDACKRELLRTLDKIEETINARLERWGEVYSYEAKADH